MQKARGYFDINKVSLHVFILYSHAVEAVDGVSSSKEEPNTIKEHILSSQMIRYKTITVFTKCRS